MGPQPSARGTARLTLRGGIAAFAAVLAVAATPAQANEHAFADPKPGQRNFQAELTARGTPDIEVRADCPPAVVKNQVPPPCTYTAYGANGQAIAFFGTTDTTILGKGRYRHAALVLLRQSTLLRDKVTYFLMDDRGRRRRFADPGVDIIAAAVTRDEQLVAVTETGVVVKTADGETVRRVRPPGGKVRHAAVGVNPDGHVAVAAILDNGSILLSDTKAWKALGMPMARHGDRRNVLAVHPVSDTLVIAAAYRFVNVYNKGLIFAKADFAADRVSEGHLFNSDQRNVGFDPQVFADGEQVVVSATDATNGAPIHFIFPLADADRIGERFPGHIQDFQNEETYSLAFGFGLSQLHWHADSRVKDGDSTRAWVDYEIAPALFRSYSAEGRILNARIAVSYLEQQAQRRNALGSRVVNTLVDFNDLFAPSWDLRLFREEGRLEGTARFTDTGHAQFSTEDKQTTTFRNTFTRNAVHVLFERGWFAGLESTTSTLPSAVGFSNSSGDVLYTAYDPDVEIHAVKLVGGYERLAYARRYETVYRGFNYAISGGLGESRISVAGAVARRASELTGKSRPKDYSPGVMEVGGDVGYILQDRFRSLRGAGYQFSAGVRLKYTDYSAGIVEPETDEEKEQAKADKDKLFLEFKRTDLVLGLYVQFNMLF